MKRAIFTAALLLSMVATASAGHKDGNGSQNQNNRRQGSDNSNNQANFQKQSRKSVFNQDSFKKLVQSSTKSHGQSQSQSQNTKNIRPSWMAPKETIGNVSDKKQETAPKLRPLNGDGRVMTPMPTNNATLIMPVTNGPPGHVWNNGHWERSKANGTSVNTSGMPVNAKVEIREHQSLVKPTGGGIGHGNPSNYGGYGVKPPPVGNNGTVKVTDSVPRELTGVTVYGSGIGIKEIAEGVITIHNPKTHIDLLPPWGFEAVDAPSRDHRKPTKHSK